MKFSYCYMMSFKFKNNTRFIYLIINFFVIVTFLNSFPLAKDTLWKPLFSGSNGTVFYVDLDNILKKKDIREIKLMIDLKNSNVYGDKSSVIIREINCRELMYRDLETNFYKSNLGNGEKGRGSGKIGSPKWKYSHPGSSSGEITKIICKLN